MNSSPGITFDMNEIELKIPSAFHASRSITSTLHLHQWHRKLLLQLARSIPHLLYGMVMLQKLVWPIIWALPRMQRLSLLNHVVVIYNIYDNSNDNHNMHTCYPSSEISSGSAKRMKTQIILLGSFCLQCTFALYHYYGRKVRNNLFKNLSLRGESRSKWQKLLFFIYPVK